MNTGFFTPHEDPREQMTPAMEARVQEFMALCHLEECEIATED